MSSATATGPQPRLGDRTARDPRTAVRDAQAPARRGLRHAPRRVSTATAVLRAIPTGQMPALPLSSHARDDHRGLPAPAPSAVVASRAASHEREHDVSETRTADAPREGVRGLRIRDLAASGGAAAITWTIALHLGLLGTALGTFVVSVGSAVLMAVVADSFTGARRMLLRWVRKARWARQSTSRRR